jgi:hypothetical protein
VLPADIHTAPAYSQTGARSSSSPARSGAMRVSDAHALCDRLEDALAANLPSHHDRQAGASAAGASAAAVRGEDGGFLIRLAAIATHWGPPWQTVPTNA